MNDKRKSKRVPVSQSDHAGARREDPVMFCTEFQNTWDTWDTGTRKACERRTRRRGRSLSGSSAREGIGARYIGCVEAFAAAGCPELDKTYVGGTECHA